MLVSGWGTWVASFVVPAVGFCLGFAAAYLVSKKDVVFAKTVAFETGVQSVPTALAVIMLSFQTEHTESFLTPIILYGLATIVEGFLAILVYKTLWKCLWKGRDAPDTGTNENSEEQDGAKKGSEIKMEISDVEEDLYPDEHSKLKQTVSGNINR